MHLTPSDLVLSIYPNSRGCAYVLFEGPLAPYDWGIKEVYGPAKNRRLMKHFKSLIDRYSPTVIVMEEWTECSRPRADRIADLCLEILDLADRNQIPVIRYSSKKVREHFAHRNALTKYDIAVHIAKIIPALSYQLPPERRSWNSERSRQGLYDAAAVGLTYYSEQS